MPRFINLATFDPPDMDEEHSSHDYHNFSQTQTSPSSATHRLPTLNGVQALLDAIEKQSPLPTGLAGLDATLDSATHYINTDRGEQAGGIPRGGLTEIYGPPGSGKTHFAIQLAANTLKQDDEAKVVWIDTSSLLPWNRLKQFLVGPKQSQASNLDSNGSQAQDGVEAEAQPHKELTTNSAEAHEEAKSAGDEHEKLPIDERLTHLSVSSLPHLLAVTLHPNDDFPPPKTSLLIIDNFSALVLQGLPQNDTISSTPPTNSSATPSLSREDILSRSVATRRAAMLSSISSGLSHLAAARNISVLVLNNVSVSSNRRNGAKTATLQSALNATQWNENVATRIAIYRDFWPVKTTTEWHEMEREERRKQRIREQWPLRVAAVERMGARDVMSQGVRFVILKSRLHAVDGPGSGTGTGTMGTRSVSRLQLQPLPLPQARSPALPLDEDGEHEHEQAMSNLELEDAEEAEVVDQGLQMPEDEMASSSAAHAQVLTKRGIEEVADSEDEEDTDIVARRPSARRKHSGFLPSSQLTQDADDGDNDDMLLQK